jgi:hypothetical protein
MLCKEPFTDRLVKKLLLAAALLLLSIPMFAATKPTPQFSDTLSKSTLAVYVGKQECGYNTVSTFFGSTDVWSCEFKSRFTCTATVVEADGRGSYAGLTAGHCFSYEALDKGYKYYVSDNLSEHPVVSEISLQKFANEPRYDYAVFTFHSLKNYVPIEFQKEGAAPPVGTETMNVNFSLGVVKQVVEGKVLSTQITGQEDKGHESLQGRFFVAIGIGPGASGSAIVDKKTHKIVGMVEAVFPSTQMATIVVPMGNQFVNFMDDASAGLKPEKSKAHVPTFRELVADLLSRIFNKIKFWS